MDDLQRRLQDADPITGAESILDAPRLDALMGRVMMNGERPDRTRVRSGRLGLTGLGAATLATVLMVSSLARPSAQVLAWSPEPVPATDAQKAAAAVTCADGAAQASGTARGGGEASPSAPPPLIGLELHGTGAIGILADAESTGYCLLGVEGGGFVYGGLAYGSSEPAPVGSLLLGGMSTDFQGMAIGMLWGSAPDGVATVRVDGGPGDGGIATVEDGHFAIWIPGSLAEGPMEAVALDASGAEVARQALPTDGTITDGRTTPDPSGVPVEGTFAPSDGPADLRPTPDPSGTAVETSAPSAGPVDLRPTPDPDGPTASPDPSGPTISEVTVPATVTAGTRLTVSWRVTDPSGIADVSIYGPTVWMKVGGPSGWINTWCAFPTYATRISGTAVDGRFQATCDLPATVVNGEYSVWLGAASLSGNSVETSGSDGFTVIGGATDSAPPVVTRLTISSANPAPGSSITFRWRATDETGVSYVMPWAFGPNGFLTDQATGALWLGSDSGRLVSGTAQDGTYEVTLQLSAAAPAGTYTVWLSRADLLGNKVYDAAVENGVPVTFTVVR
jgi:hypothetical protein